MQRPHRVAQHKPRSLTRPSRILGGGTSAGAPARRSAVLAVSEDSQFLIDLWTWLASHSAISVQIAENERTALNALTANDIRSVVLDLRMGELRALPLLRQFAERPSPPVLVLVSSGEPRAAEHLLRAVGQPMMVRSCTSVQEICEAVGRAVDMSVDSPTAVTPAVLATLVSLERATGTITFDGSSNIHGELSFSDGALVGARAGETAGEEAALRLLGSGALPFTVSSASRVTPDRAPLSVRDLLTRVVVGTQAVVGSSPGAPTQRRAAASSPRADSLVRTLPGAGAPALTEEKQMALENVLQQLKEIKGYKASGIMHFTGEMLAADSADPQINLAMVGATFNDIFRSAHEASKKIGLDACRETTIVTPKGIIVMACSGVDSKAHIHMIGVLAADGNHSLMRMQIGKLLNDAMGALT